jgi:hypothetical protein
VAKESAEGTPAMRNLEAIQANRPERTIARAEPALLGKSLAIVIDDVCNRAWFLSSATGMKSNPASNTGAE